MTGGSNETHTGELSLERRPATTRAGRVRVLKDEPSSHYFILEVDLDAVEVEVALHVAQDLDSLRLEDFVHLAGGLFGEVEHVAEATAPAALHADAQGRLILGQ